MWTALGPAMLVGVAMTAGVPGSKVIVCTDGMANYGLGDVFTTKETLKMGTQYQQAIEFYDKVTEVAQRNG